MNLSDLFQDDNLPFSGGSLGGLAKSAIPMLLLGLLNNANNESKAASLANALAQHEDDELDITKADMEDGKKIVQHIFGRNAESVTNQLARQNNLSASTASDALGKLAPLVLGKLAKETKNDRSITGLRDAAISEIRKADTKSGGMEDLLGGLMKDGSLGDILGDLMGGGSKSAPRKSEGGLGDILGDLMGGGSSRGSGGGLGDILGDLLGGGSTSSRNKKQPSVLEGILGGILKR